MKKIIKTFVSGLVLTVICCQQVLANTETACDDETGVHCWTCGANCKATLYADGKLLINGTGSMNTNYHWQHGSDSPWLAEKENITSIEIKGVSNVSSGAFSFMDNVKEVKIDNSVKTIDNCAFCNMHGLHSIDIPDSVLSLGTDSFHNTALSSVTFGPESKLTELKQSTFEGVYMQKLVLPPMVTTIGGYALSNTPARNIYCTGHQIETGICSSQSQHYELDDGMYVVYNSDGTINSIYESNVALLQGRVADSYTKKDINGNPVAVYDGQGNIQQSYIYNDDGSVKIFNAHGKLIGLQGKRILSVDEASALVKDNKNTFKLKYR